SVAPPLVPVIARLAHERGMRVSGHIPAGMIAAEAVRAGYDEVQHANMLLLNFMPDVKETRTPARFTEVGKRGADIDVGSAQVGELVALFRARGTAIDPTLATFEDMYTARDGKIPDGIAAVADRLPGQVRRSLAAGRGLPVPAGMDDRYRKTFDTMVALVGRMYAAGITVVAGTDAGDGFTLHRELELYVRAGIPAPEVLAMATLGAARV